MNTKLYKTASFLVKVLSVLTGLAAYQDIIPAQFLPVAVVVFAAASTVKDFLNVLRDYADDGKINKSYQD